MRKEIFESEEEFIEVLEKTCSVYDFNNDEIKYYQLNNKDALSLAISLSLIKKSPLEEAKKVFFKFVEDNGYQPKPLTEYIFRLCQKLDELEKALENK